MRRNPLERLAEMEQLGFARPKPSERDVVSLMLRLLRVLGRLVPTSQRLQLRYLLYQAGLGGRVRPEEVFGLKLLGLIVLPLATLYLATAFHLPRIQTVFLLFFTAITGFTAPNFWLSRQIVRRRRLIERHLSDFVDLLATCVEAGLGLDAAIDRIARRFPGPLSEEFQRYLWEVQIGRPRNLALTSIAERTGSEDVRLFVAALIQAELFGVPIVNVLRAQAEALRERRFQRSREEARRAPLKMLPVLAVCFFPIIFLLLIVPLLIRARDAGVLQFFGF